MEIDLLFFGQFIFAQKLKHIPETWNTFHLQGWTLATHSSLPVISLQTKNKDCIGWLVGFPINSNGELIQATQFFLL